MTCEGVWVVGRSRAGEVEPGLFFHHGEESTALCALKTAGAAIAENISARYPF
nr:hypothetical protein [Morganella morganii]